jgi:hypothetical protein
MNLLPNHHAALIEDSKLLDYALNPNNERGQHKARLFESTLGYNLSNWSTLKQRILDNLEQFEAIFVSNTPFGQKYKVTMAITGTNDRIENILTIWQYDRLPDGNLSKYPRLVTVYVSLE